MQQRREINSQYLVFLKQQKSINIDLNNAIDSDGLLKLERMNQVVGKNAKIRGYSYLHAAIEIQDYAAVKFLVIECKVDVNKIAIGPTTHGFMICPLGLAMKDGIGCTVTPKHGPSYYNNMSPMQKKIYVLLLGHGAEIKAEIYKKSYAPSIAAGMFLPEKFKLEMEELLNYQKELGKNDTSLLHKALRNADSSEAANLIASGEDVNAVVYGETPLHIAVENKLLSVVKALLACERFQFKSIQAKNWAGKTPLDIMHDAVKKAFLTNIPEEWKIIIELLLSHGAIPHDEQNKDFISITSKGIEVAKFRAEFQLNSVIIAQTAQIRTETIIRDQQEQRRLTGELVVAVDRDISRHEAIIEEQMRLMIRMEQEMRRQREAIEYLVSENESLKVFMLESTERTRLSAELSRPSSVARIGTSSSTFFGQPSNRDEVVITRSELEKLKSDVASLKGEALSLKNEVSALKEGAKGAMEP